MSERWYHVRVLFAAELRVSVGWIQFQDMPLTEIEREITKSVAQLFYTQREATSHEQLLRAFGDPRPIINLRDRLHLISAQGVNLQTYLPTILAFQYCGDETLRQNAKSAVEVVINDLKLLFRNDYNSNKQYPASALISDLQTPNAPVSNQVAVGLFLVKEIPGVFFGTQLNEKTTEVVSFRINEHILTLEPKVVWDEYVRAHTTIEEPPQPEKTTSQQTPKLALKKTSDWPPSPWKIVESLGEGGQGYTFKVCRSGDPDRQLYVLKRLKNKERLSRFKSEIAALTKLQHPGILKIIETSGESETPFFVAEYCEGYDLSKANLSSKDLLTKLQMFRQVCDAVAAAHKPNILHRDLKPQNIFIRKDGSIVVGDFGLCIDLNDAQERATQTLEAVGADRYIAPEVAKGRVAEPQATSDLYSLGKVLYFILSRKTLIWEEYAEGEDDLRTQDASPNMHFIYEIFDKTITKRPEDRYPNATALLNALDSVIERVQSKAHILKTSVHQRCMFCVVGEYRAHTVAATNEFMYVCGNCGNIQHFMGSPHLKVWWEQK
jgi:serine/threonine protein kinase